MTQKDNKCFTNNISQKITATNHESRGHSTLPSQLRILNASAREPLVTKSEKLPGYTKATPVERVADLR